MTDGYNNKSCNLLRRPFYRPAEAALRWCGLVQHEPMIMASLGPDGIPRTGRFPQWPCLQANTEIILDAIENGELPCGRDGKSVRIGEPVAREKLTVRHSDLRDWMAKHHPGSKPDFLFDEVERNTHSAINADSVLALQIDRDAVRTALQKANTELQEAREWASKTLAKIQELESERNALLARLEEAGTPGTRAEATYLNVIGALVSLVLSPREGRVSEAAVIRELVDNYSYLQGIAASTLQAKFAAAKRQMQSTQPH